MVATVQVSVQSNVHMRVGYRNYGIGSPGEQVLLRWDGEGPAPFLVGSPHPGKRARKPIVQEWLGRHPHGGRGGGKE